MASKTHHEPLAEAKMAASRRMPRGATVYELRFKASELEEFKIQREPGGRPEEATFACSIVIREPTPTPAGPTGTSN